LTLKALSHADTIIFLGMTKSFLSRKFFQLLESNDLHYEKVPFDLIQQTFQQSEVQENERLQLGLIPNGNKRKRFYTNIEDLKNIGLFSISSSQFC
jgi:hypothetical protein